LNSQLVNCESESSHLVTNDLIHVRLCLQSSAVREISDRSEAMVCLLILSTSSLYLARITNYDQCTRCPLYAL